MKSSFSKCEKCVQAVLIIGTAFFYFLVFGQFAFLHRLSEMSENSGMIELAMLTMGIGGIVGSIVAAIRFDQSRTQLWLVFGFLGTGLTAVSSIIVKIAWIQVIVAFLVGLFLGILTVAIVPVARKLIPTTRIGLIVSFGVGLAYFLSNVPWIFNATPKDQTLLAALACCVGAVVSLFIGTVNKAEDGLRSSEVISIHLFGRAGVLLASLIFLVLVWLDSAAFYVIQASDSLKAVSWSSDSNLWGVACIHLLVALLTGWTIDRGYFIGLLLVAFAMLEMGAYVLEEQIGIANIGTALYVGGVSIYSTCLVSYGALCSEVKETWRIPTRAAWVFALGGWIGSGLGIGMAKDLNHIPVAFLLAALIVVLFVATLWMRSFHRYRIECEHA